jgi:curved DNA-binding protein CbpA
MHTEVTGRLDESEHGEAWMSDAERDPYQVLGLGPGATTADVTRAWRRLARVVHPDSRPGDSSAAEQFRALSDAYGLLSDPSRRAAWDHDHRDLPERHYASPDQQAAVRPTLRPFGPAATSWPASGLVHGATVRAGPVHIQPPAPTGGSGPPGPTGSSGPPGPPDDPDLPRLLAWLALPWQEWPW